MPASLLAAIERQWPFAHLHLHHQDVPKIYRYQLPPPGFLQFLRCLHSLHLDLNVNEREGSRYFVELLRKTIRFPNLRTLHINFCHKPFRHSPWWGLLPPTTAMSNSPPSPVLTLHMLILRGMTNTQLSHVPWDVDNELFDWTQLRHLEITHAPRDLLVHLRGRLPHLRAFVTGPSVGEVDAERQTEREIWSAEHWYFIDLLPPLEQLGLTICGLHVIGGTLDEVTRAALSRHGPTLRTLTLFAIAFVDGWVTPLGLSADALQEIQEYCPDLEELAVNINRIADWVGAPPSLPPSAPVARTTTTTTVPSGTERDVMVPWHGRTRD